MDYVFGRFKPGRHACILKTLQHVEDTFELMKGIPRSSGWSDSATLEMSDSFPDNLQLEDFIDNRNNLLVASDRVRALLAAQGLDNVEYLPVTIINHKGRLVSEPYFVLNVLRLQDCIDLQKSEYEENKINPEVFMTMDRLVIDEDRIEDGLLLFRMQRYPDLPIFHRKLAEAIESEGLTGIEFGEIEDWEED